MAFVQANVGEKEFPGGVMSVSDPGVMCVSDTIKDTELFRQVGR